MPNYDIDSFIPVNKLIRENETIKNKLKMEDIAIKSGFPSAVAMYQAAKRLGLSRIFSKDVPSKKE